MYLLESMIDCDNSGFGERMKEEVVVVAVFVASEVDPETEHLVAVHLVDDDGMS